VNCTTSSPILSASIVFSLLFGGFALSSSNAAPRNSEAEKKNTDYYIELVRRDLRQDTREIIGEKMAFKQAEADAFWPVYDRYEAELKRLGDEKLALINDYADNYKNMTEAKAGELTSKAIDLDESSAAVPAAVPEGADQQARRAVLSARDGHAEDRRSSDRCTSADDAIRRRSNPCIGNVDEKMICLPASFSNNRQCRWKWLVQPFSRTMGRRAESCTARILEREKVSDQHLADIIIIISHR
jgi:hypothetical protein